MRIELYKSMLEKEGAEGEEEAKRAYIAAREKSGCRVDAAAEEKVLSALTEKVRNSFEHDL
jgi:LETM1 and EF-hand domain-containing protein 1, mitochondrial